MTEAQKTYPPCAGMNCGATDGVSHSPECRAEHAAAVAGGRFVKGDEQSPAALTERERFVWNLGYAASLPATPQHLSLDDRRAKAEQHGFKYWNSSDDQGVTCSKEQAVALLQDLLLIQVEIESPANPQPVIADTAKPVAIYQCMATDEDHLGFGAERVWSDVDKDVFDELSLRGDVRSRIVYAAPAIDAAKPVAWRLRIGSSDVWSYVGSESDADFYGEQSGLKYEKEPLYTAPAIDAAIAGEKK